MEQPKKPIKLTETQRQNLIYKIKKKAQLDPIFKAKVEKMLAEKIEKEPKYLTEAHRKNSEALLEEIKIWKETPSTLEYILAKQRIRDQQARDNEARNLK